MACEFHDSDEPELRLLSCGLLALALAAVLAAISVLINAKALSID